MIEYRVKRTEMDWIEKTVGQGAKVVATKPLTGGTAAALFRCTVDVDDPSLRDLVLRRYPCAEQTETPEDEAWAMRTAASLDLPTPTILGHTDRLTLFTYLPGRVVLEPEDREVWLRQMASALYAIHRLPANGARCDYFPYCDLPALVPPEWSTRQDVWAHAIDIARGPAPADKRHFLHRDFHPCNVLFESANLSGVIDWTNACRGMAGVDVAHCRWNLALMYGLDTADRFLNIYRDLAGPGWNYAPYFDLVELVEKLAWKPEVYPGWPAHGLNGLTDDLMLERTEDMLLRALSAVS